MTNTRAPSPPSDRWGARRSKNPSTSWVSWNSAKTTAPEISISSSQIWPNRNPRSCPRVAYGGAGLAPAGAGSSDSMATPVERGVRIIPARGVTRLQGAAGETVPTARTVTWTCLETRSTKKLGSRRPHSR